MLPSGGGGKTDQVTYRQVVLQGRSRHENATLETVLKISFRADLSHAFKELSLLISKAMRFIDNGHPEGNLADHVKVTNQRIVGCDKNIEL